MFRRVLVLFVLLGLALSVYVQPVLAQDDLREFHGYQWYDDGIAFTYSIAVAADAGATFLPATADTPEEIKIIFQNYHNDEGWLPTGAEISIMPASSLQSDIGYFSTLMADFEHGVEEAKQQLINASPDVMTAVAQTAPLTFKTGSGVRFVMGMQDGLGATNISYRYIGVTSDEAYLISAVFPFIGAEFIDIVASDISTLEALTSGTYYPDLITLDALINSLVVEPPTATSLTSETSATVSYENIQFHYDPDLAYRIEVDNVAAITGAQAEQNMFGVVPGYTLFSFVGYPSTNVGLQPQIFILPISEFPTGDQPYGKRLLELRDFFAAKPELYASAVVTNPPDALPILPIINAAQTIVSQPQYMRFGSGEGVRYITYYSQSAEPLTADDLFYAYVGLSDDGQYAVAGIFPLFADFLPHSRAVYDIADIDQFMMNYGTYLEGILLQINVMDWSAYTPDIQLLDEVISSLTVP